MSTTVVTATYLEGNSVIAIPAGYNPEQVWLLVNGQVWTGNNFAVSGNTIVVPSVDLSGELIQISQVSGTVSTTPDLSAVTSRLDNLLTALTTTPTVSTSTSVTTSTNATKTNVELIVTPTKGFNRLTGRVLSGIAHLEQSITDILLTPLGSRVMRRDYGSRIYQYIDSNLTPSNVAALMTEVADAIEKWEPRFSLTRCKIDSETTKPSEGKLGLLIAGIFENKEITLGVVV